MTHADQTTYLGVPSKKKNIEVTNTFGVRSWVFILKWVEQVKEYQHPSGWGYVYFGFIERCKMCA